MKPKTKRIAWRSRLADSGPGYRPRAALSPTDLALAQPGHDAHSQVAKGPGDATHIHASVLFVAGRPQFSLGDIFRLVVMCSEKVTLHSV